MALTFDEVTLHLGTCACKHTAGTPTGHRCGTRKPPRQLRMGTRGNLHAHATCVAWHGGVPPWAPGSPPLLSGAVGFSLVLGSSSVALPLAVLPVPGRRVPRALQNSLFVVPQFRFMGPNGSLGFIPLRAGQGKRLIPQGRAQGAPRRGEVAGSGFGVVTVLCAVPCSVVPPPPGGMLPAVGTLSCCFGKDSGPEQRIPCIIHAPASPGGWVTAGAQPPAPHCLTRGVPWEAGGSSRRAVPRLPSRRPSAMPSGGPPAAEGATHGHVPRRNRAQVNTPLGQAAGSGAGRCAGSGLAPAWGIVSQGPTRA